jgi:hypothetical protein
MHNPCLTDKDAMAISNHGGIGGARSYVQRLLGNELAVEVQRVNPGHYRATISTNGKSMANRMLGDRVQLDGQRLGDAHYRGVLSTGAKVGVGQRLRASTAKRGTLMARTSGGGRSSTYTFPTKQAPRPSRGRLSAGPMRPRLCDSLPSWCAGTGAVYADKNGKCWCREPGGQGWLCAEPGGHC